MSNIATDPEITEMLNELEKDSQAILVELNRVIEGKRLMAVVAALSTLLFQNEKIMSKVSFPLLVLGSKVNRRMIALESEAVEGGLQQILQSMVQVRPPTVEDAEHYMASGEQAGPDDEDEDEDEDEPATASGH